MKQNNKKAISIKWKLFIYLSVFTGAILILLWLFQVVFLDSFYKTIKTHSIKSAAEVIENNIDNINLDTLVTRVAQSSDVCILVTDENGKAYQTADMIPDCIIHHLPASELYNFIEKVKANNGSYIESFDRASFKNDKFKENGFKGKIPHSDNGMMESIVYIKAVKQANAPALYIFINANISPVNATVQTIRIQLVFVTAIMLIFALLLALLISKRVSAPIIEINNSAKELAKGNYDVEFNDKGYKEISELGSTLNYAASELSKTENLRRELIANISHDLRTPLTMITGYSEVMRDIPGENTPENVQIIIDEAKRLTTLVNDVLDISKLQSGTQTLNITKYSITESIKNILKRYSKLTEQKGYKIQFIYDCNANIIADELKMSQVIYNLINNAITYTGEDKSIIIRQSVYDGSVKIEVTDTGEGIPEDKLSDIWDRYYKVDKKHKRAQIGTGLGLSIVKSVLEMHHARYGVESTIGRGSTFWFELKADR